MAISHCDSCGKFRPGSSGESCGCEGFFCHICRGDELDPYCEIEDAIEAVETKLARMIRAAESGAEWADICAVEANELAPLLALRMEAARQHDPDPHSEIEVDCHLCDGAGCHECSSSGAQRVETEPVTLADLDDISEQVMAQFDATIAAIRAAVEVTEGV